MFGRPTNLRHSRRPACGSHPLPAALARLAGTSISSDPPSLKHACAAGGGGGAAAKASAELLRWFRQSRPWPACMQNRAKYISTPKTPEQALAMGPRTARLNASVAKSQGMEDTKELEVELAGGLMNCLNAVSA